MVAGTVALNHPSALIIASSSSPHTSPFYVLSGPGLLALKQVGISAAVLGLGFVFRRASSFVQRIRDRPRAFVISVSVG